MAKFEGQERRMPGINACLKEYGMNTLEDARDLTLEHGINVEEIVKGVQPIAFDNAVWAYTLGTALAPRRTVGNMLVRPEKPECKSNPRNAHKQCADSYNRRRVP